MSSYLNIFLKRRDTKEYLYLDQWSRSSEIYQRFYDVINPAYAGMEDKYTDLTTNDFDEVIKDIAHDKAEIDRKIRLYEKYLHQVIDFIDPTLPEAPKPKKGVDGENGINDCLETLQYLKEEAITLDDTMNQVNFYASIQSNCKWDDYTFECIAVNID